MKKTTLRLALCLGMFSAGGVASAIPYSWNLNQHGVTTGASLIFDSIGNVGPDLTVTAYRSGNADGTGTLVASTVIADDGLGVISTGDSGYPDAYTLDNRGYNDVLVFDSGTNNFDWTSFALKNIYSGSGGDATPNVTYWTGNKDSTAFTSLCLTGNGCSMVNHSFARTDLTGQSTSPISVPYTSPTSTGTGRYLVISGALGAPGTDSKYDKFKIGTVGAAPEPQSMALLGIGLLSMLGMRRRSFNLTGLRMKFGFA